VVSTADIPSGRTAAGATASVVPAVRSTKVNLHVNITVSLLVGHTPPVENSCLVSVFILQPTILVKSD